MQSIHVRWHFSQSRWRPKVRRFSAVFFLGIGGRDLCNHLLAMTLPRRRRCADGVQDDAGNDLRTVFDVCAGHFVTHLSRRGTAISGSWQGGFIMLAQSPSGGSEIGGARTGAAKQSKKTTCPLALLERRPQTAPLEHVLNATGEQATF